MNIKKIRSIALKSKHPTHMVGAIAMRKGTPISSGTNSDKTHPKMIRYGQYVSCHAEWQAIIGVKNKKLFNGSVFITYSERKDGTMRNARPCELCLPILIELGVDKIIYSTDNGMRSEKLKKAG